MYNEIERLNSKVDGLEKELQSVKSEIADLARLKPRVLILAEAVYRLSDKGLNQDERDEARKLVNDLL